MLGMFSTHYRAPHRPADKTLKVLDLLATQAAALIERAQVDAALSASEERLRRVSDNAGVGLIRINRDWIYLSANPAYAVLVGMPLEQIVGHSITEVLNEKGVETIRPYIERVLRGEQVTYEAELPFVGSGNRYLHVNYTPDIDTNGQIAGWIASITDITEQQRQQRELELNAKRLSLAQRAASAGIWDWDMPTGKLIWSREFYELFGLDPETAAASLDTWRATLHPDDLVTAEARIFKAIQEHHQLYNQYRIILPSREIRWIETLGEVAYDANGQALRMTGICIDMTRRKHDEIELEKHRKHLEELVDERTRELSVAKQAAEVANIAKSAFLANMSHEMRTPLHQIAGLAQLVRRDVLSPKQTEFMDKLDMANRNLTALIDTVLQLTKIEAGRFDIVVAPFSLEELLSDVLAQVKDLATAKGLHLATEVGGVPDRLIGDKNLLRQALLNYLDNAIRFTEAGNVTLRTNLLSAAGPDLLVRFEVEDTGLGIASEDLPRLFNIFEKVDMSSTQKYGGIGLGLAMTKKFAEMMGGDVGGDSKPGRGSTFWFTATVKKSEAAGS